MTGSSGADDLRQGFRYEEFAAVDVDGERRLRAHGDRYGVRHERRTAMTARLNHQLSDRQRR
jgi:hypothetical protein